MPWWLRACRYRARKRDGKATDSYKEVRGATWTKWEFNILKFVAVFQIYENGIMEVNKRKCVCQQLWVLVIGVSRRLSKWSTASDVFWKGHICRSVVVGPRRMTVTKPAGRAIRLTPSMHFKIKGSEAG